MTLAARPARQSTTATSISATATPTTPNGQKQSYTAPDGTLINYADSAHGQLNRLTIPGEGDIVYSNFKWTRPQTITYPGNTIRTVGYDALLRTKTIQVRNSQKPGADGLRL